MAPKKKKPVAKKKAKPARKTKRPAAAKKKAAPKKKKSSAKKARKAAPAEPPQTALPWRQPVAGETKLGVVDDYFGHLGVIALTLENPVAVGDKIHVHGHTTDLTLTVESIQVAHESVQRAEAGAGVGIKVGDKCRAGDYVFRVGP